MSDDKEIKPVTRKMLIDFRDQYKIKPKYLAEMFGLAHPNAWFDITKVTWGVDKKGNKKRVKQTTIDENTLVDVTIAISYNRWVNDPEAIEKLTGKKFSLAEGFKLVNRYLGLKKKEEQLSTEVYSQILGRKKDFYDRVMRTGSNQTLPVQTLQTMLTDAIKKKDHAQVFTILEAAKREALARGDTINVVEYQKILDKKKKVNEEYISKGKATDTLP